MELKKRFGESVPVHAAIVDVTNEKEVQEWVEQVGASRGGRLDGLVNNAAVFQFGNVEEASLESWKACFNVNVFGYATVIKHAIKFLKSNHGGSIVNMSSQSAFISQPGFAPYNSSKAAIEMLTKCTAQDFGIFNIRSNTVAPGTIMTPATLKHAASLKVTVEKLAEDQCKDLFLKRLGKPEDVANAVLFLLSDESSYITGTHILVDGGNTAH